MSRMIPAPERCGVAYLYILEKYFQVFISLKLTNKVLHLQLETTCKAHRFVHQHA